MPLPNLFQAKWIWSQRACQEPDKSSPWSGLCTLCVVHPWCQSSGHRRTSNGLGGNTCLYINSITDSDSDPQQIQQDKVLHFNSSTPFWLKQLWFLDLLNLSKDKPIPLPLWKKMLKQPRSKMYHQNLGVLTCPTLPRGQRVLRGSIQKDPGPSGPLYSQTLGQQVEGFLELMPI